MVADIINLPQFSYERLPVDALKVEGRMNNNKFVVDHLDLDGRQVEPTQRFWDSLCARFGISPSIFRYFEHSEVFNRIAEKTPESGISLTLQETPGPNDWQKKDKPWRPKLMAVAGKKGVINFNEVVEVLNEVGTTQSVSFSEGCILSEHELARPYECKIGEDVHGGKIFLETPIDGYGKPNLFLMLLRFICTNGMIARTKAFKSQIILGKGAAADTLIRNVASFSNEQGFIALKDRLEAAQGSWASIHECVGMAKTIRQFTLEDFDPGFSASVPGAVSDTSLLRNNALRNLYDLSGDLQETYGIAQVENLTEKQMRMAATKATVYDLINLASEMATHQLGDAAAGKLHAYVGRLIGSDIFDLEGSCDDYPEFKDFFSEDSRVAVARKKAVA
jgi:hypothetical protein